MAEMTAQKRYDELAIARKPFVDRARYCAEETIPALLPPEGHTATNELPMPYSGFGAKVVETLASRLTSTIYPPGGGGFRLTVPPEVLLEAEAEAIPPEMERMLALLEELINTEMERAGWRNPTTIGLQHLIVCGNFGEYMRPDGVLKVYRLDQYVVVRDPMGTLLEALICEKVSKDNLPEDVRSMEQAVQAKSDDIPLYTWIKKIPGKDRYQVHQEVGKGGIIPNTKEEYDFDVLPYHFVRWAAMLGEDYGRSKVEEHLGDFRAINGLTKSVVDGAAMASRHVTMVRSNSRNLIKKITDADNGDVIAGDPEAVGMLKFENIPGMQITQAALEALKMEVGAAFAMQSAVQRDAERVTAFEIQKLARELEDILGGVFSQLSNDIQGPRLDVLMYIMNEQGKLPEDLDKTVEPIIVTGLEALGREQEASRVGMALQMLQGLPPEVLDYVNWQSLLTKTFNGLGLPDSVNAEEKVQQIRQQRVAEQIAAQAGGAAGQEAITGAVQQATQGQQQEAPEPGAEVPS